MMKAGLLGKKLGMTQMFTEDGHFVPITVVEAGPCTVLELYEGYVRLGFGDKKEKRVPMPEAGFYKKIKVKPKAFTKRIQFDTTKDLSVGGEIKVDIFREKEFVDITGISKGKGFQGGVKRWHWRGGPGGHGSMHHRRVGSIGGSSFPSRVWKGQKFPGRMGNDTKTVQNLEIAKIYKDKNLLLVKGPVPGANGGYLEIKMAKKIPPKREKVQG